MKTMENKPNRTVMTHKGQVVIPVKIRRHLGLKGGSRITIYEQDGEVRMVPLTAATIDKNFGMLKGGKSLTQALLEERKREREREDRKV